MPQSQTQRSTDRPQRPSASETTTPPLHCVGSVIILAAAASALRRMSVTTHVASDVTACHRTNGKPTVHAILGPFHSARHEYWVWCHCYLSITLNHCKTSAHQRRLTSTIQETLPKLAYHRCKSWRLVYLNYILYLRTFSYSAYYLFVENAQRT